MVAVHPSVPAKTLAEFVDYARRHPGRLTYGTPGVGSLGHVIGETFKYSAKVDLTHVPYRGAGPALSDAFAGQVQVLFDNLPSSLPHIQRGKLRALAVSSEKRVPALPEVPRSRKPATRSSTRRRHSARASPGSGIATRDPAA